MWKFFLLVLFLIVGFLADFLALPKLVRRARVKGRFGQGAIFSSLRFWLFGWTLVIFLFLFVKIEYPALKILPQVQKLMVASAILSVTFVSAKIFEKLLNISLTRFHETLPKVSILSTIVRVSVYTVGILLILRYFGLSISPILAGLGIGGLAVALALQETLGNVIAGLNLILSGKIKVGDYVKLDSGEEGYIHDISWRSTTLRELSNNLVIIPNSKLSSSIIKSFHLPDKEFSFPVELSVSYDCDLDHVEKVISEVARDVQRNLPGAVPDFEPVVRFNAFGENGIRLVCLLRAKNYVSHYFLKHEFIKRIHRKFKEENIEIPYPQLVLHYKGRKDSNREGKAS